MWKKILSFFISFLLFLSAFMFTCSFVIKAHFDERTFVQNIRETDLSKIIKEEEQKEDSIVSDVKAFLLFVGIPSNTIDEVMNSDATKSFIGKYAYDVLEYFVYQKEETVIQTEDLTNLVLDNFFIIDQVLKDNNQNFLDEHKDHIIQFVQNHTDEVMKFFPTASDLLKDVEKKDFLLYKNISFDDFTRFIQFITSNVFLTGCVLAFVFFSFLIFILHFKSKKYIGIFKVLSIIFGGVLVLLEILLETIIKPMIIKDSTLFILENFITSTCESIWFFIFISFFLFLVFFFLQKIVNKIQLKNA